MGKFSFAKITSHLQSQGFMIPGSEIYGGLANSWDYGVLGTAVKNHLKTVWREHYVRENPYNVEIDPAIIMNPKVWQATGHVDNFHDPLIDCKYCHARFRADDLIKSQKPELDVDGMTTEQMNEVIASGEITCPTCGKSTFTPIRQFQMMFKTFIGVTEEKTSTVYLRPETAQGLFVNFKNVMRTTRSKLPIGICDIGKAFRNEITPGNFTYRMREFEQMEIEFFFKPGEDEKWFEYYKNDCMNFVKSLGIKEENLRYRDHEKEELAFYSKATTDIEYAFPWGWGELMGIASRTNYDLSRHQEASQQDLTYLDPETNERYLPHVVEPSFGVDRLILVMLTDAYDEEQLDKDTRIVMHLAPRIAPYSLAVLPLSKQLNDEAYKVYLDLLKKYDATYDLTGSIGKRYRRQDAIGTPLCITFDFDSLEDKMVTVRDRDTMEQTRISISELHEYLEKKLGF
ncbi:glycine--tRNA ligase [Firmicutes bacterium CAG:345]|jgi:glycine--tRNA ligase|nr:glycine--tRNA ligase [Firmicutes bacterium CAG:345]